MWLFDLCVGHVFHLPLLAYFCQRIFYPLATRITKPTCMCRRAVPGQPTLLKRERQERFWTSIQGGNLMQGYVYIGNPYIGALYNVYTI